MSRPKKAYRLFKRETGVYYYRLPGMFSWKSTGHKRKTDAENLVIEKLKDWEPPAIRIRGGRLRDFIEPYYVWDKCPRIAERRADGKRIGRQHADRQRDLIEKYILRDEIADMEVRKITRGHVKDFKSRLIKKYGTCRRVNSIITVLKTVFRDGVDRELLKRDPAAGIGKVQYDKIESGVFSAQEIGELFPAEGLGPWEDRQDYTTFLIAATCGLRRGEILALQWQDIDFESRVLNVQRAWVSAIELGEPKWGQNRIIPLPARTLQKLKELRTSSFHVLPDALIFHKPDGSRKGETWFSERFHKAMFKAKIKRISRCLKPHSFRHSLNTILRDRGIPDDKIRAAMGWSNPQTQDSYTHWKPEHLRGQADIIDGIFD